MEAQKEKSWQKILEQEDCQANEGDEEETVLLGAEVRRFFIQSRKKRNTSIVHIVDVKNDADAVFLFADVERIWKMDESGVGKMQEVLIHWGATRAERFHPEKSLVWQRQLSLSSEGLLSL